MAKPEEIARICHEVNRAYCLALGDDTQRAWVVLPAHERGSAIRGVEYALRNPETTFAEHHERWMEDKVEDGWVWGPTKQPDAKPPTHPCLLPYDELPKEQQIKDHLFKAIVSAMEPDRG